MNALIREVRLALGEYALLFALKVLPYPEGSELAVAIFPVAINWSLGTAATAMRRKIDL